MANIEPASGYPDLQNGTAETPHGTEDLSQTSPRPGRSSRREREASKQRKHVTNACQRCRLDKVKCDSNTPCARCVERSFPCTYRSEEDGRSRQHVKRKIEQLEDDCKLLHNLIETFRSADDERVAQIISFIRSDASLKEIDHFLVQTQDENFSMQRHAGSDTDIAPPVPNHTVLQHPVIDSEPFQREPFRLSPANVLSIDRLVDVPPYKASAAPWTKVTDDNHLVSHLISLWTSWDHAWPDGIVLECFLSDMKQGRLGAMYCSPLLVNSMLAAACLFSDFDQVKSSRGKCSDLVNLFVNEAEHHLQEELKVGVTSSITTMQGLTVLYHVLGKLEEKEKSYRYAMLATKMCAELLRTSSMVVQKAQSIEDKKLLSYVVDYACWGVFCNTTSSLFHWKQPQNLHPPSRAFPDCSAISPQPHSLVWVPYLQKGQEQDRHMEKIMRFFATLAIVQHDLTHLLFGNNNHDGRISMNSSVPPPLSKIEFQLHNLYDKLPQEIKTCKLMLPSVFQFLWSWHVVLMTVLSMQVKDIPPRFQSSNTMQSEQNGTLTYATVTERLLDSATEIANLARLYRFQFGYSRVSSHVTQALDQAIDVLLSNNLDGRHDSDITEMCTFLCTIARRVPSTTSVLRIITARAEKKHHGLPVATAKLLEDFNEENINS